MGSTVTSGRIVMHMVVRNEASRYLKEVLDHHWPFIDDLLVYDDQSTDDTAEVADSWAGAVKVRPDDVPSFREDESAFRQAAWAWMSERGDLHHGDWVLCIDADEFLVGDLPDPQRVRQILTDHQEAGLPVTFPVAEVFDQRADWLYVRTDGFWSSIMARRFVPWSEHDLDFVSRPEGGGSVPRGLQARGVMSDLTLLHMGYADPADRRTKYERYSVRAGDSFRRGHSSDHVESILRSARTKPWTGVVPEALS
jgi:glycosyltransferase involved in cell wall biosynthesis